jgi:hypothetical protein
MYRGVILSVCFWLSCWLTAVGRQPVSAQTINFSDDFSQGLSQWQPTRDDGKRWQVVNGQAEATMQQYFTVTELVPTDAVWNPEWKNLEYQLDFFPQQGVDRNISFGFKDLKNWYELHFNENSVHLVEVKNGIVAIDLSKPFTLKNGQTYQVKIRFQEGGLAVHLNDQELFNEHHANFTGRGKIGLKVGSGAVAPVKSAFDNIIVRPIDSGTQLSLPHFKQTDPQWKDQEYDSASAWSSVPTINRWGCALTSMAMIMQYHGLVKLPDGTSLTPAALNTWLKSQPDGYIGAGAINWLAVTRLTRLINEVYGTKKLEYKRVSGESLSTAITEILAHKPVVLEIAGHFLVGHGVTDDQHDLYIKDPAYSHTQFSQHQKLLLSTRTFQPSLTDLSYLLFAHQPGLTLTVTDGQRQAIPHLQSFEDVISDPSDQSGEKTPPLIQHQLVQPNTGTYHLTLTQPTLKPFMLEIIAYDQAANPTLLKQTGYVGTIPLTFTISYSKTEPSQLKKSLSFTQFRQDLHMLRSQRHLISSITFANLDRWAALGEQANVVNQKRYVEQIKIYLKSTRSSFTALGYGYTTQQLQTLEHTLSAQP